MFKNTQPFKDKFDNDTDRIRVGVEVPPNGVNLAHYYCPPLVAYENVVIGDNSGFIIENTQQQQGILMNGTVDNILCDKDGKTTIESELVEVTDKFSGDIPLYYAYKLKKLFCGEKDNMAGTYYNQSIKLVDLYNNKLPKSMAYKIVLQPSEIALKEENAYNVFIYTSFQIENNYAVKCVYNSIEKNKRGEWVITPDDEEIINPQVFYKKANSVIEAITTENMYYLEKSTKNIKCSIIYMNSTFKDPRTPHKVKIKIGVTCDNGDKITLNYPQMLDGREFFEVYNSASAIHDELPLFSGKRQCLTDATISQLTGRKDIISVKAVVSESDNDKNAMRIYVRPDGKGKLYAETLLDTGVVSNIPDKHFKKVGNLISVGYSIRFKDRNPIKLLQPREEGALIPWHVRIQNGRFTKTDGLTDYYYYIPEYYSQLFDKKYGFPYKNVNREKPRVISKNTIKVKNTPLFIDRDGEKFNNISIYRKDINGNQWPMFIESWNDKDGTITTIDIISENDDIYIDYMFEEESYPYKGYVNLNEHDESRFVLLDVNPNQHHYMTDTTNSVFSDVSTFRLITKTLYFYIKPAIIDRDGVREYNDKVIEHSIFEYTQDYIDTNHLELIGIIYVRPNSSQYSMKLTDARTRGGGVLAEINDSIRTTLEPESDYYWDIGYWDGQPYNENSVIIVRLDKRLLVEHGGRFTDDEINIAVNKHCAVGTYAMVEYVDTYDDDSLKIKNLEITKTN